MFKTYTIHTEDDKFYISSLIDEKTNKYVMPSLNKCVHDGVDIFIADSETWLSNLQTLLYHYIEIANIINNVTFIEKSFNDWYNKEGSKDEEDIYEEIIFSYGDMVDLYDILTEAKKQNII